MIGERGARIGKPRIERGRAGSAALLTRRLKWNVGAKKSAWHTQDVGEI